MVHLSSDYNDSDFNSICELKQKSQKRKNRGSIQLFNEIYSRYTNSTIHIYSRSKTLPSLIMDTKTPRIWKKEYLLQCARVNLTE